MDLLRDIIEERGKEIRIRMENALHKADPYNIFIKYLLKIKYLLLSNEALIKMLCYFVKKAIGTGGDIGYTQIRS